MALVVCAGTSLVTGAVYGAVLALATGGRAQAFKAVSPVTLTPWVSADTAAGAAPGPGSPAHRG